MNLGWDTIKQLLKKAWTWTGAQTFTSLIATTADINGGTIDGATVGATTPAAGTFTTLTGTTVAGGMLATSAEAIAGTSTDHIVTPAGLAAAQAVISNPKAMSQGVAMTAATSGSNGIAVADDDDIDYGTGNFFGVIPVLLADYTPSAEVVLEQKTDGTNGREFTLQTNGKLRVTINTTDYDSTVANGCTDNTKHVFGYSVTRETADVAGSIIFVVDGVQIGDAVAITAGAPTTINNAVSQYVLGTSATRTAGTVNGYISGNRALTAAEHLDLYRNGIAFADKWGSQTAVYTSDFSAGVDSWSGTRTTQTGNIDGIGGQDDNLRNYASSDNATHVMYRAVPTGFKNYRVSLKYYIPSANTNVKRIGFRAASNTGSSDSAMVAIGTTTDAWTTVTYKTYCDHASNYIILDMGSVASWSFAGAGVNTDDLIYIREVTFTPIGATLALEDGGIQPAPGQCLDSSSNKLHAMQPATGSSLIRYKKEFEFRSTNVWTASSAAQYIGGFNQNVTTSKHMVTQIIPDVTVTTDVENIEIGNGSDVDYYVAAVDPSSVEEFDLAHKKGDGTNLKLVVTPAAEATMTIEFIVKGIILE